MREYEGLFLVDDGKASDDFQSVADHITNLIERHGGSIEKLEKWDSRRLAYEIAGKRRGAYILVHFQCEPDRVAALRHDCQISNLLLRAMILRRENVGVLLEVAEEEVRQRRRKRAEARLGAAAQPAAEPAPDTGETAPATEPEPEKNPPAAPAEPAAGTPAEPEPAGKPPGAPEPAPESAPEPPAPPPEGGGRSDGAP